MKTTKKVRETHFVETVFCVSSYADRDAICNHLKECGYEQGSLLTPAHFSAGISTDDGLFVLVENGKEHDEIVNVIENFCVMHH